MGSQSKLTGNLGENIASIYLREKGYTVVESNFCIRGGEIDLITQKNGILVFVEVKTRRTKTFGPPEESMTRTKKRTLLRTIFHYLQLHPQKRWQCDLLGIKIEKPQAIITHFPDIFSDL